VKNIVLIGMPGAGKSTVGVLLAKALGMPFIDTDLKIQEEEGKLLQEIIDTKGIEQFIKIEERVALNLNVKNHVIATGGSIIYGQLAMEHLKKNGLLVYLKLPYKEIERRVKNITTRGIAMAKGQTLLELYKERVILYERYADIIVDCSNKTIEDIVSIIKKKVRFYGNI